jgi:hypothetical protein
VLNLFGRVMDTCLSGSCINLWLLALMFYPNNT